jgi:hypothetical protein
MTMDESDRWWERVTLTGLADRGPGGWDAATRAKMQRMVAGARVRQWVAAQEALLHGPGETMDHQKHAELYSAICGLFERFGHGDYSTDLDDGTPLFTSPEARAFTDKVLRLLHDSVEGNGS